MLSSRVCNKVVQCTDPAMIELAKKNAAIGAGHSFIVFLGDGFYPSKC